MNEIHLEFILGNPIRVLAIVKLDQFPHMPGVSFLSAFTFSLSFRVSTALSYHGVFGAAIVLLLSFQGVKKISMEWYYGSCKVECGEREI